MRWIYELLLGLRNKRTSRPSFAFLTTYLPLRKQKELLFWCYENLSWHFAEENFWYFFLTKSKSLRRIFIPLHSLFRISEMTIYSSLTPYMWMSVVILINKTRSSATLKIDCKRMREATARKTSAFADYAKKKMNKINDVNPQKFGSRETNTDS